MARISLILSSFLLFALGCSTPASVTDTNTPSPTSVMQQDFRANAPEPGPAPAIELGDFQDFKLDNGLTVVLVENHKLPRVSYQLFVDVPLHLEGEFAGTGDIMGSMLRRATANRSKLEIDEEIDFIGASLGTSGSGASAQTISKHKEKVLELMSDVVLNARFPESEFKKVKSEAEAGLAQATTTPGSIANRVRQAVIYGKNHPFGELMTEESLDKINLEVVQQYYDTYFVPNRSYLVMVGDLNRAEAEMLAKKYFSDWEAGEVPSPEFVTPERPDGVTVNFVPRPGAVQSNIVIAHPIELEPGTKEDIRASLLNIVTGGGFNSRLLDNLREDKGYTYGASSAMNASEYIGNFRAGADVRNEVTDSAIVEFMYELNRLATEPISEEEIQVAKNRTTGSFGRALESPNRIASYALNTLRYGLDRDFYPNYLKTMAASSQNDLFEVAKEIITPDRTHIIVVGDKSVADKLAQFATSGKVNYYDADGDPIDMEAMTAPTDATPASVINKYISAIGGAKAIAEVSTIEMMMEANIQGQTIQQSMLKMGGDKFSSQTTMMGMTMADQRYNAGKAKMVQQGQTIPLDENMTNGLAEQAQLFPIAALLDRIDDVEIEGSEMVDGKTAVVLNVDGGKARHYFDTESGLLVRTVQQQGPATVTVDYGDYKETSGVKFPYAMTVTGAAPFPLEMKTTSINLNGEIDESLFAVD